MKIQTQLKVVAGLVAGLACISNVQAESATVNASVTVSNALDLTATRGMAFGTVAGYADTSASAATATLVIPSDPSATATTASTLDASAKLIILDAAAIQSAQVDIVGAAPDYALTIDTPADTILIDPSGTSDFNFKLSGFTRYGFTTGDASPFNASKTDATGDLGLYYGATLTTTASGGTTTVKDIITDGNYVGTFDVVINY